MKKGFIEPNLVHIPARSYLMGTTAVQINRLAERDLLAKEWKDKGFFKRESPPHSITLDSYFIGKYPVTVEEFRAFVTMGGYHLNECWSETGWAWREAIGKNKPQFWEDDIFSGEDKLPVVGVSWYEAAAYCHWLGMETGNPYRLPTEAEWGKAATAPMDVYIPGEIIFQPSCATHGQAI